MKIGELIEIMVGKYPLPLLDAAFNHLHKTCFGFFFQKLEECHQSEGYMEYGIQHYPGTL